MRPELFWLADLPLIRYYIAGPFGIPAYSVWRKSYHSPLKVGEAFRWDYQFGFSVIIPSRAVLVVVAISTKNTVAAGLGALLTALSYAFSPKGYAVSDNAIIVKRLIGNVRIALDGIREVRPATPNDLRGSVRLFGSGGMFGWYGLYRTSKLGKSTWYVSNRSKAVVVIRIRFYLAPMM